MLVRANLLTKAQLSRNDINLPDNPTLLSIVKALHDNLPSKNIASEYGQLAIAAAVDALGSKTFQRLDREKIGGHSTDFYMTTK